MSTEEQWEEYAKDPHWVDEFNRTLFNAPEKHVSTRTTKVVALAASLFLGALLSIGAVLVALLGVWAVTSLWSVIR